MYSWLALSNEDDLTWKQRALSFLHQSLYTAATVVLEISIKNMLRSRLGGLGWGCLQAYSKVLSTEIRYSSHLPNVIHIILTCVIVIVW